MQLLAVFLAFGVAGAAGTLHTVNSFGQCAIRDHGTREVLLEKVVSLGVPCEDMCKSMGAYPNCQCPGFEGQPASSDDTRACFAKYCQDPASPCPSDAFVTCVKELTKVSVLQWDALFAQLSDGMDNLLQTVRTGKTALLGHAITKADSKAAICSARDEKTRSLLQTKVVSLGVPCEDMCKSMGAYPNCQCPGFEGQPASSDDTRACFAKYCQDPASPCPSDAFVTCVKELTKVSVLQWDALFAQLSDGMDNLLQTVRTGKSLAHN